MSQKFCQDICREKNFLYLNGKKVLQPKVSEIIIEFLKEDQENYVAVINKLLEYWKSNVLDFRQARHLCVQ